ncbi:helix-turn-helix domain-containing protein [Flavobacterium psychroterrae]|uniref:Helix-turn-helix domain-containing protein n=1 Tax=Flavobacterium psychroterrae TaxID=2133767 RepID=A0ABS5PDG4_9FLAO|nr:helix-turn-helix transcriptional regulator [Flavobacterium psychroterrae]MBS7232323.1 helix-turn-helix domain-containing protein [Flavobacterium psychroterrae]
MKIPIYNQRSEAVGGIFIAELSVLGEDTQSVNKLGTHRDDFYNFFVLTKGKVIMKCDMIDVKISAPGIIVVKPFQIHSPKFVSPDSSGYYISVAPFLVPDNCASVFENMKIANQVNKLDKLQKKDIMETVLLLHRAFQNTTSNKTAIVNGLFSALVYRFVNIYSEANQSASELKNQSTLIYSNFKKLISGSTFLETPSYFAAKLNITTSHLNYCVNISTGKSVTYWLQNAMILEAQRLLYYTENDVKEIAFTLGFEDHTYFSRLFKKITGETPLTFRLKFRE